MLQYEPVWAIGTGKVATPEIAQDVHAQIRTTLADMYGAETAEEIRILYGGSVSPDSVDGLMAKPDIDGTLVGGASLSAESFGRIINFQVSQDATEEDTNATDVDQTTDVKVGKLRRAKNKLKTIFSKA